MSTIVVLGGGGHTAEMLNVIRILPMHYKPFHYISARCDQSSYAKAHATSPGTCFNIIRTRPVHSWLVPTGILRCLVGIFHALYVLLRTRPRRIYCNGPGLCVPVMIAAWILKRIRVLPFVSIIYMESVCRVSSLSLSGKAAYFWLADHTIVFWEHLHQIYPACVLARGVYTFNDSKDPKL